MATRVFKYRQANVTRNSVWGLVPTTGSEVATRVIINAIHVKTMAAAQGTGWVNFFMHLNLIPNGITIDPSEAPGYGNNLYNKITVASFVHHTTGGNSNLFPLPQTITFRSGNSKSNSPSDPIWLLGSSSDFLKLQPDLADRALITGSGYLNGSGYYMRWDIPEQFYMGPGDSLQLMYGGYYSSAAQYITDTSTIYFSGANIDLVCIAESN